MFLALQTYPCKTSSYPGYNPYSFHVLWTSKCSNVVLDLEKRLVRRANDRITAPWRQNALGTGLSWFCCLLRDWGFFVFVFFLFETLTKLWIKEWKVAGFYEWRSLAEAIVKANLVSFAVLFMFFMQRFYFFWRKVLPHLCEIFWCVSTRSVLCNSRRLILSRKFRGSWSSWNWGYLTSMTLYLFWDLFIKYLWFHYH